MSNTKSDRELSERSKADVGAIRQRVSALEDELIDNLIVRVQDLHMELMFLKDAAIAVRDLRAMRKS